MMKGIATYAQRFYLCAGILLGGALASVPLPSAAGAFFAEREIQAASSRATPTYPQDYDEEYIYPRYPVPRYPASPYGHTAPPADNDRDYIYPSHPYRAPQEYRKPRRPRQEGRYPQDYDKEYQYPHGYHPPSYFPDGDSSYDENGYPRDRMDMMDIRPLYMD